MNARYFLHQHPRRAISRSIPEMRKLANTGTVCLVDADICRLGLRTRGKGGIGPVKKPIRLMPISRVLAEILSRACQGVRGACPVGGF